MIFGQNEAFGAKRYSRSDLACEFTEGSGEIFGVSATERTVSGFVISATEIMTAEASKRLSKPIGKYYTVDTGNVHLLSDEKRASLAGLVADILGECVRSAAGLCADTVLIAGLGNRNLTADAVGPLTVEDTIVTRSLKYGNAKLFSKLGCADVSAIAPGVAAETGIEAADMIAAAAKTVGADVIVLVDALAARSCSRLCSTIQLTNTGISPGSGIGNSRTAVDRETTHVPVVTVGVPTVVDSSTLIYEALSESNIRICGDGEKLDTLLSSGRSFFVSPQDADVSVREISAVIAAAINKFCKTDFGS